MHFICSTHKNKYLFLFFIVLNISICSIFTQNKFDETDKKFENIKTSGSEKKDLYEQIGKDEDDIQEDKNKAASFQEKLYKRTFNTIQKAERIDNKYRALIEKVFAFLYKKIDLNLIGDLLEEKTKICKENTISLELIKKDQIENWNQYIAYEAPKNTSSVNESIGGLENNSEKSLFIPTKPIPLTQAERDNGIGKIISKNFIGKIPNQVQDIVDYFGNYEKFSNKTIEVQNMLLLHGEPGVGKSHLVKVIARALQLPILSFTGSFFGDKYIGESSRRIRLACTAAKDYGKPLILFIDEIDALAAKRNDNMHNEHRAALLTLLDELQKLKENKHIVVFVATNDLKALDEALKDRFAGTICEIKDLDIEEKTHLFSKFFNDKNFKVDYAFSHRLAEVTKSTSWNEHKQKYDNRFSNRDIEYIANIIVTKHNMAEQKQPLCVYARQAIDNTGKKGSFSYAEATAHYCNGI